MDLHEFQAKTILKKYGVPIPEFFIASSLEEARNGIDANGWEQAVVKVQVHAGGRGKAGGVKFAENKEEILECAEQLLGMKIVNQQTGPEGMVAHQVMICFPSKISKEFYLGAAIDRNKGRAMLIASSEGGMEIEEAAAKSPDKIIAVPIHNDGSIRSYHLIRLAKAMGWELKKNGPGMRIAQAVARAFIASDATLLEINPLVETPDGELLALDAKMSLDDNALYRLEELSKFYDQTQVSEYEREAKKADLAYIAMEGSIGCMVNGAGLAMATMDIIEYYGGSPANFLDVGGSAGVEKVAKGFHLILSDPKVKAVLVNIFGGIMNCETIAEGIVSVVSRQKINVPLVVRMEGTNVESGKKILEEAHLNISIADDLKIAAEKAVEAAKE